MSELGREHGQHGAQWYAGASAMTACFETSRTSASCEHVMGITAIKLQFLKNVGALFAT
jgi:hypothetical protein